MGEPVTIEPPLPKRCKKSTAKQTSDALEAGTKSCRNCEHFHEGEGKLGNDEWGECWRFPQKTLYWEDGDGSEQMTGSKAIQILPYYCGELKPRH
jgi:hypothetical protein